MKTLTIKGLIYKSDIRERTEFMDAYKKGQRQSDGGYSSHIVTPHYELIQTIDGECEIQLLYTDKGKTYQLYKDILNDALYTEKFNEFLKEIDYMFDVYETAQLEYSLKHM